MSPLNLDSPPKQPGKKKIGYALIASACLAGVIVFGSTFAGNISLNGGGDVEFGQGYLTTTTCDPDGILVTPITSFFNKEGPSSFTFNAIQVENVSANCAGKDLIIRVHNSDGQVINITTDGTTSYNEARVFFQPFSTQPGAILISDDFELPNIVSPSGYWEDQFSLVNNSAPIVIGTLSNLFQLDSEAEVTAGSDAFSFFEVDQDENSFQVTFDPTGEFASGFADSKNVYYISIQSVDHQS
jgi:hypothetical protein